MIVNTFFTRGPGQVILDGIQEAETAASIGDAVLRHGID